MIVVVQVGLLTACLDYLKEELVNELKAPDAVNRNAWSVYFPWYLHFPCGWQACLTQPSMMLHERA